MSDSVAPTDPGETVRDDHVRCITRVDRYEVRLVEYFLEVANVKHRGDRVGVTLTAAAGNIRRAVIGYHQRSTGRQGAANARDDD
jgi:hypothetical protein